MPEDWLAKWCERSPVRLPRLTRDEPQDYPAIERADEIAEKNRRTGEEVLEAVLPLIQ